VKKWIIALLFVFACLPVVAVKAAPPQTYIHLDYEIIGGYYNIGDGGFEGRYGWLCSNRIQIPKNVDKLYFNGQLTHFILFFNGETYIGHYYDEDYVYDLTWETDGAEKKLGVYHSDGSLLYMLDVSACTHIVLQSCVDPMVAGLEDYIDTHPHYLFYDDKPLIYYPAPADAADNITFGLMPALMVMVVIAGMIGGLIMIAKKSKR